MKKFILITLLIVVLAGLTVWPKIKEAGAAITEIDITRGAFGTSSIKCKKITYATEADYTTNKTFVCTGSVLRVVVDVTVADADADIAISDQSGYTYLDWENKLGSGDISYVVTTEDVDGNTFGGVPVYGTHTITLTAFDSNTDPMSIYIYYKDE